jgi:YfiH family protein
MGDESASRRPAWTAEHGAEPLRIRLLGRGGPQRPEDVADYLTPSPESVSWLKQVHSARVVAAAPGRSGTGDALITEQRGTALAIATADCVPVLLATPTHVAAAHAGWRGLVAGVLAATLERLAGDPDATTAWLGPAIGACCYEVGDEVAGRIAEASTEAAISTPPGRRAHADLHAAAVHQLRARGVDRIHRFDLCTRCHADLLWSYRRDGASAGRNWSVIWRD